MTSFNSEQTSPRAANDSPDPALVEAAKHLIFLISCGEEADDVVVSFLTGLGLEVASGGCKTEADRIATVAIIEYSAAEGTPAVQRAAEIELHALSCNRWLH